MRIPIKAGSIRAWAALILCILLSAPALASQHDPALDEVLSFGDFRLDPPFFGGQPVAAERQVGVATQGRVVGFTFRGTVEGVTADHHDHTWASDICVIVTAPDGTRHNVGGRYALPNCYPNGPAAPVGPPGSVEFGVRPWDFQRATDDGTYQSSHHDAFAAVPDAGVWTFDFIHDHNHEPVVALDWSNVTITLHKIAVDTPFQRSPGKLTLWRDMELGYAQVGKTTLPTRGNRVFNSAGGGGTPLQISSIELVGDPQIQRVGGTCGIGSTINPGDPVQMCTLSYSCAPTAVANYRTDVVVTSTDGQRATSSLTCAGLNRPPLTVQPARHHFGRIDPAASKAFDFTVRNNTDLDMFFIGWGSGGGGTNQYQLNFDDCLALPAGATCTLSVTFAPGGTVGSWRHRFLPQFFASTTWGTFFQTSFDVSGSTTGAGHLQVLAVPPILLPADGGMRHVRVLAFPTPWTPMQCAISAVRANEPIEGDFEITGDMTLNLRAERMGNQRIYTIEVKCTGDGREHVGTAQVRVPRR